MRLACNFQPGSDCDISGLINHRGPGHCQVPVAWDRAEIMEETFTRTIQLSPVTKLAGPIRALRHQCQPMRGRQWTLISQVGGIRIEHCILEWGESLRHRLSPTQQPDDCDLSLLYKAISGPMCSPGHPTHHSRDDRSWGDKLTLLSWLNTEWTVIV